MKEQLISFKIAKLAKKKGFNEPCLYGYDSSCFDRLVVLSDDREDLKRNSDFEEGVIPTDEGDIKFYLYTAPTQSLLQKWLREEHDMHILIEPFYDGDDVMTAPLKFISTIFYTREEQVAKTIDEKPKDSDIFNSYENALEDALFESLKLIKK